VDRDGRAAHPPGRQAPPGAGRAHCRQRARAAGRRRVPDGEPDGGEHRDGERDRERDRDGGPCSWLPGQPWEP
jgi:hypothetical protein